MLDIGWTELLVVAIVLIIVVGPKDLPPMLRAFGRTTTKLRKMANEFRGQFDEALREADLDDVRKTFSDARSLNPMNQIRDAVNPLRQTGNEIRKDLEKSVKPVAVPDSGMKLEGDPKIESDKAVEAAPLKGPVKDADAPAEKPAASGSTTKAKTTAAKTTAAKTAATKAAPAKSRAKAAGKSADTSASRASEAKATAKTASKASSAKTGSAAGKSTSGKTSAAKTAAGKTATGNKTAGKPAAAKPAARKAPTTAKKTSRKSSDKA
jgi:sec-independent protein translocase protein TatB